MKGRRNKKMSFSEDCVIGCVEENMYSLNENISILSNKYKSFSKLPNKIMELIAINKSFTQDYVMIIMYQFVF